MRAPTGRSPRPTCDYPFDAAQRLAGEGWRSWVAAVGKAARRLAEVPRAPRPRRTGPLRRWPTGGTTPLRRACGAALIAIGRRAQGATDGP